VTARNTAVDEQGVEPQPSRTESAYDRTRAAILTGELEAGRTYSQVALVEQLEVSRTPLREAIRRLQSEGLLESERGRRILVAPLNSADLEQLYAMRISQESLGVCLSVPRLNDSDVEAARAALDEHLMACERRDLAAAREPHRTFHQILFSGAGSRLVNTLTELWDHAERYRRLYFKEQDDQLALLQLAASEHEALYNAAEQREGRLCAELIARHLARTALTVAARQIDDSDPTDVRVALRLVIQGTAAGAGP
jgi:DNA-binding GntR family transcriptional regulator